MNKFQRILKNPLVLILPIVAMLLFAWQQHTTALAPISTPVNNLLTNGGMEEWSDKNLPTGWQVSSVGDRTEITRRAGHNSPSLLAVTNLGSSQQHSTALTTPSVDVHGGSLYFFKGYYTSSIPYDLTLQTNLKDGTSHRMIIHHYDPSATWTTFSHLFVADSQTKSVQFIYNLSAQGELQIDNCYLEANPTNVYRAEPSKLTNNLLKNAALVSTDNKSPDAWSSYVTGEQKTNFGYVADGAGPYLHTQVTDYKNGEAKWQYDPITIHPNQLLKFHVTYQGDTPADVVAEYVRSSGERQFQTITTLLPVKDWTEYSATIEAPTDAKNVVVTVVQRANGALNTKAYALYDISKPGAATWQQPITSITFDDGWQSVYKNAIAPLSQAGYKATFYLNPSSIDTPNFMNSDEVNQLQSHGYELASHGLEHLDFTTLAQNAAERQLKRAYQYLTQVHNLKTVNFATPYGNSDPQVEYIARKYYSSMRGAMSGINTRQNFNPYNLSVMYIGRDTPITKLTDALNETKAKRGWLILVYHRVDTAADGETVITPTQFKQQLTAIQQSGIGVQTVQAALQSVGWQ